MAREIRKFYCPAHFLRINVTDPLAQNNSNTNLALVLLLLLIERWQAARESRPLFISSLSPEQLPGACIMSALFSLITPDDLTLWHCEPCSSAGHETLEVLFIVFWSHHVVGPKTPRRQLHPYQTPQSRAVNSESVSGETSLVSRGGENIPPERLSVLLKVDWVCTTGTKHIFLLLLEPGLQTGCRIHERLALCTRVQRLHLLLPAAFCLAPCLQPRPNVGGWKTERAAQVLHGHEGCIYF